LSSKVRKVHGYGKFEYKKWPQIPVRKKNLCIACVNEDAAENQSANPDDQTAKVERARLHHGRLLIRPIENYSYFWLSN
jgi:hypothetical protein